MQVIHKEPWTLTAAQKYLPAQQSFGDGRVANLGGQYVRVEATVLGVSVGVLDWADWL
jgi:hypothetical protein